MKTLIKNSFIFFRTLHPIPNPITSVNRLSLYQFATVKKQTTNLSGIDQISKQEKKLQAKSENDIWVNKPQQTFSLDKSKENISIDERKMLIMSMSQESAEKQALQIIGSYITIDEVKSRPCGIRLLLLTFIRVLEYEPSNRGREFYLAHKSEIEKIFYDLRCYNAQSMMSIEDIILTYYFYKLLQDNGYQSAPTGFELRSAIKLARHVPIDDSDQIGEMLSLDQVVHARWLMAATGISNHEFKWNSHIMMVQALNSWRKTHPYEPSNPILPAQSSFPIKFHHICAILISFHHESIHISIDFKSFDYVIKILFFNSQNYISYEKLMENQKIFLETFTCLIGVEFFFFPGQNFHQTQTVVRRMAAVIERRLLDFIVEDKDVQQIFVKSDSLDIFFGTKECQTYRSLVQQSKETKQIVNKITDQDIYRYFILLNEIHENESLMQIISPKNYQKIFFLLKEIFDQYFSCIIGNKEAVMNGQIISIYVRFWLIWTEKELQRFQKLKLSSKIGPKKLQQQIEGTLNSFSQLTVYLLEKFSYFGLGAQKSKYSKSYLTTQEKQTFKEKNHQLKKIDRNIVSPIIDFIYKLKRFTSRSQKVFQQSRVVQIIDKLELLLTSWFGDTSETDQSVRLLSRENKYFWILKIMRINFTTTSDNKVYLKQFESLLLEQVVNNNLNKHPQYFYTVFVYNLYGYMCLLQEKMMQNEGIGYGIQSEDVEAEGFYAKKQYRYFLAYKNYLTGIIYAKNQRSVQVQSQEASELKVPDKLRIDSLFRRSNPQDKQTSETGQPNNLRIADFYQTVFRQNRFYNHKLLSEQFLVNVFGSHQLFTENFTQYIQKQNQRYGKNFHEIIFMILLAGDKNPGIGLVQGIWDLVTIKQKVFQALTEKSVGSLLINIIREVASPRKSSLFNRSPLKYRLNPNSLFEAVRSEPFKLKKQVLSNILQIFYPVKSISFGFFEILLQNLHLWNRSEKSNLVWGIIIPWVLRRIQDGQITESSFDFYLNIAIRLARRCQVQISPKHEHVFLAILSNHLPRIFLKISKACQQRWRFREAQGYLLDLEFIYTKNPLNLKNLTSIFKQCYQILLKNDEALKDNPIYTDKKSYNQIFSTLERLISTCQSSKKTFNSSGEKLSSNQSQKVTSTSVRKLFKASSQKELSNSNRRSFNTQNDDNQSGENVAEEKIPKIQYQKNVSNNSQSRFSRISQKKLQVKKNQESKRGLFSKKE